MKTTHRQNFIAAALVCALAFTATVARASDPLPSWNNGPAKKTILQFVRDTTDKTSVKYVKPEDRIATFDQDGTLWVSHPLYTQAGDGARLMMLVHHDNATREYAYGSDSKVGTFSQALMDEAKKRRWVVISIKQDWKRVFPLEQ